ncbi:Peptidase S41 [Durusdinium trenchii]|uniref:Peptidase S41 n=1 Tax=Durusdinium trenchii TaxID=1381693 RepID=A0ABP0LLC9_9DINO
MLASACAVLPQPVAFNEETFTRDQLITDFDAGLAFIKETHPDLSYSAKPDALDVKAMEIRASLTDGMTAREAWRQMALLNPVFADAHVGFRRPLNALEIYQDNGGSLFPLPIVFDAGGVMRAAASGPGGVDAGDRIVSINGISADNVVAPLLERMRGETAELGRLVLQLYFPIFFWVEHGGYDAYSVRVKKPDGRTLTARLAEADAYAPADDYFTYRALSAHVGYLKIDTFNIEQFEPFKAFLESAFADIKADQIETLIIDVRENGGGANDLSDELVYYLTDQPYSFISSVKARITEQNIQLVPVEGVKPGMVLDLPLHQTRTPPPDLKNRYSGDVYVLTGPMTYSASIVFATTVQDYGIGKIAGAAPIGAANQTGQVQTLVTPNTKLEALSPLYIFRRPNGDKSRSRITVDIPVNHNPLDPEAALDDLLSIIAQ